MVVELFQMEKVDKALVIDHFIVLFYKENKSMIKALLKFCTTSHFFKEKVEVNWLL